MKIETFNKILDGLPGTRKDGAAILVNEETDVSVYIGLSSEVLTIGRLSRITVTADLLSLETHKGDRYYFTHDLAIGLKVGVPERPGVRGTGFR